MPETTGPTTRTEFARSVQTARALDGIPPRGFWRIDRTETEKGSIALLWNLKHPDGKTVRSALKVYAALRLYALGKTTANPSHATLAAICGIEREDTVQRALAALRSGGWVSWAPITGRIRTSNTYQLSKPVNGTDMAMLPASVFSGGHWFMWPDSAAALYATLLGLSRVEPARDQLGSLVVDADGQPVMSETSRAVAGRSTSELQRLSGLTSNETFGDALKLLTYRPTWKQADGSVMIGTPFVDCASGGPGIGASFYRVSWPCWAWQRDRFTGGRPPGKVRATVHFPETGRKRRDRETEAKQEALAEQARRLLTNAAR